MIEKLKQHPKVWAEFDGWLVDTFELEMNFELALITNETPAIIGYLYRFLDDKGIEVFIIPNHKPRMAYIRDGFAYIIFNRPDDISRDGFKTRPEEEEAALIKAFEILEERIK